MIDLVLRQAQINENLTNKLASNDELFENINSKIEGLNNLLSLNKMFETQLAQIASTITAYDLGKILGHLEISFENINAVIMRDGKSTRDLPYPNHVGKAKNHGGKNPNLRL